MSRQALQTAWRFLRPSAVAGAPTTHPACTPTPFSGLLPCFLPTARQQRPYGTAPAPPSHADPFTAKLQKNTEQQLLEMVHAARAKKLQEEAKGNGGAQQAAAGDGDGDEDEDDAVEVGRSAPQRPGPGRTAQAPHGALPPACLGGEAPASAGWASPPSRPAAAPPAPASPTRQPPCSFLRRCPTRRRANSTAPGARSRLGMVSGPAALAAAAAFKRCRRHVAASPMGSTSSRAGCGAEPPA
jgi:hypothetical protein